MSTLLKVGNIRMYVCMYVKRIFSFLTIKRLNYNQPGHGSDKAHPALVLRTCTIPLRRVMRIDRLVQFYPFMVQVSNQIDALTTKTKSLTIKNTQKQIACQSQSRELQLPSLSAIDR